MNKTLMLKQIKKHLGYVKDSEFARHLEIGPNTLNNWYRRNTFDSELLYTKCVWLSSHWVLTGEGEMIAENTKIEKHISKEPVFGGVPYWNLYVSAGHSVAEIVGQSKPDGYIKGLPGADIAENILPVAGASMEPEISSSAIVGVRRINNWETLNTERIYLIITTEDRMIKRIEHDPEDSNILWCVSPNYPKFKIYKDDIIEIQRVCFVYNPK